MAVNSKRIVSACAASSPPATSSTPSTGWRLWGYVRPYWGLVLFTLLLMTASGLLQPALIWIAKDLLKPLFHAAQSEGLRELSRVALLILVLTLVKGLCDFGHVFLSNLIGQRVVVRLRQNLFRHLQTLSLSFFEDARTGQLISHVSNDINAVQMILTTGVATLVISPLAIGGLLVVMFRLNWWLTLLALLVAPVIALLINLAGRRMRLIAEYIQQKLADIATVMQEAIAAIRIVQCFATGEREIARFQVENEESKRAVMRGVRVQAILTPLVELIGTGGLLLVLWVGGRAILYGYRLEPENLIVIIGAIQMILTHLKKVGRVYMTLQRSLAGAQRIFNVLDLQSEVVERPQAVALTRAQGHVAFDHVWFAYRDGRPVLRDITFEIQPGEVVALVGPSGAGKSTIANLIPRLYDVTRGTVRIDGHDVRDLTLASLRAQISIVPQETILFSGTIRDNIAYGQPEAAEEEIEAAARAANAHEFIIALPQGYDTPVGERGVKLSGGQRQRIAIARALLRDPRILILDEATSSLDSEAEALVQEALERLMRHRTTLVIAHRLSTVRRADRILVLAGGRIVEEGRHGELLSHNGLYSKLYAIQSLVSQG